MNKKYSIKKDKPSYYKNNIFLLTRDNYYFIIEKMFLKRSDFFKNIFLNDKSAGSLKNPIFLQKINSEYFKIIIQYLKYYHEKNDIDFEVPDNIQVLDLLSYYSNEWDVNFIKRIYFTYKDNDKKYEELLFTVNYIGLQNLFNKLKWSYDFCMNVKMYNLDTEII
jgi:hypothetical protein